MKQLFIISMLFGFLATSLSMERAIRFPVADDLKQKIPALNDNSQYAQKIVIALSGKYVVLHKNVKALKAAAMQCDNNVEEKEHRVVTLSNGFVIEENRVVNRKWTRYLEQFLQEKVLPAIYTPLQLSNFVRETVLADSSMTREEAEKKSLHIIKKLLDPLVGARRELIFLSENNLSTQEALEDYEMNPEKYTKQHNDWLAKKNAQ